MAASAAPPLMAPSVVVAPVSTLMRRFWPVLLTTRRRSATGIEVDAELGAGQRREGGVVSAASAARVDLSAGRAGGGVDRVDAAAAADRVQQAVGRPEVDADQVFAALQAGDGDAGADGVGVSRLKEISLLLTVSANTSPGG